jgi:serine/threonine-protein kinase
MFAALGAALRSQPVPRAAAAVTAPLAAPPPLEKAAAPSTDVPTLAPAPIEVVSANPPNAEPKAAPVAPARATATPGPRPARRRPSASCDPPFTVDANGYRHYKLECAE